MHRLLTEHSSLIWLKKQNATSLSSSSIYAPRHNERHVRVLQQSLETSIGLGSAQLLGRMH